MSKEIKEAELPEFLIDFIGDQVAAKSGLFAITNTQKSDEILKYAYISEQFCLILQKEMIRQHSLPQPEELSSKQLPNFVKKTVMDTLHMFAKTHKADADTLKTYEFYLYNFAEKLIELLINRKPNKPQ